MRKEKVFLSLPFSCVTILNSFFLITFALSIRPSPFLLSSRVLVIYFSSSSFVSISLPSKWILSTALPSFSISPSHTHSQFLLFRVNGTHWSETHLREAFTFNMNKTCEWAERVEAVAESHCFLPFLPLSFSIFLPYLSPTHVTHVTTILDSCLLVMSSVQWGEREAMPTITFISSLSLFLPLQGLLCFLLISFSCLSFSPLWRNKTRTKMKEEGMKGERRWRMHETFSLVYYWQFCRVAGTTWKTFIPMVLFLLFFGLSSFSPLSLSLSSNIPFFSTKFLFHITSAHNSMARFETSTTPWIRRWISIFCSFMTVSISILKPVLYVYAHFHVPTIFIPLIYVLTSSRPFCVLLFTPSSPYFHSYTDMNEVKFFRQKFLSFPFRTRKFISFFFSLISPSHQNEKEKKPFSKK